MHTRTLGQGLQVSAIGYGCMGLTARGSAGAPSFGQKRDSDLPMPSTVAAARSRWPESRHRARRC
jgi:aryl-alcohol dehydrogenase-like predicted oxidoreductase